MYDDVERLRAKAALFQLLSHFAGLATPSRETWQNRLMATEGLEPTDLSILRGELIAFGLKLCESEANG
jgi:hypothetical protein